MGTSERILDLVRKNPGIDKHDLSRGIGKSPSAVEAALSRLREAGRVRCEKRGKYGHYYVSGLVAEDEPQAPDLDALALARRWIEINEQQEVLAAEKAAIEEELRGR